MSIERRLELQQQLSDELRGLEDEAIGRIGRVFEGALRETVARIFAQLDGIAAQPAYDPKTTPGAFLGSTPEGQVSIDPVLKNQAQLILQGQLLQDLRQIVDSMQLSPRRMERLEAELKALFDRAQGLGSEYAIQITGAELEPSLAALTPEGQIEQLPGQGQGQGPGDGPPLLPGQQGPAPIDMPSAPDRGYQGGQRLSRLFDLSGAVIAAERDFKSLSENYAKERAAASDEHVRASKSYYAKWWAEWGESVSFETARQMAQGPDPRALKAKLRERIPTINEAFKNRAETIARTETLMASGEAQERIYRRLRVGFVQYLATLDDRTCEFCAPRSGCIYWIGGVKPPIHPNCRCGESPITLESLVIQNSMAKSPEQTWEAEFQAHAAATMAYFRAAAGADAVPRPVGGPGDMRGTSADYPLMERKGLPQSVARKALSPDDPLNQAARDWPAGDPVWCPRRGWLDQQARAAYEAILRSV
jgi:SPP1 gp7 family putative phage head morphogenesis protein